MSNKMKAASHNVSNVKLSDAEMQLACNGDILLTKNVIIQKVITMFGEANEDFKKELNRFCLPDEVLKFSAKIARGENYGGLPWVMLDYPRMLQPQHFFSIRTMFWWSHDFGIFLLLKGKFLSSTAIAHLIEGQHKSEMFICHHPSPWHHHFGVDNMLPLHTLHKEQIVAIIEKCGYLKIGCKLPITSWDAARGWIKDVSIIYLQIAACKKQGL